MTYENDLTTGLELISLALIVDVYPFKPFILMGHNLLETSGVVDSRPNGSIIETLPFCKPPFLPLHH